MKMPSASLIDFKKALEPCFYRTLSNLCERFGGEVSLNLFGQKMVLVNETNFLRDLMTKNSTRLIKGRTLSEVTAMTKGLKTITESDGEAWSALRTTFQKEFSRDFFQRSMEKIPAIMRTSAEGISKGRTFDLQNTMNKIALAAICEMLFTQSSDWLRDIGSKNEYLERQRFLVDQCLLRIRRTPLWKYLPIPSNFKVARFNEMNRRAFTQQIDNRRSQGPPSPSDFLDLLLGMSENGNMLSDHQIAVHMYGFIGASYESTGAVLHWALSHVAQDESLAARILEEISSAGELSPASYPHLKLCQNVIWEAIRLYPPFPMLIRECVEDIESPIKIKKGSFVFGLIGRSQTDARIWGADAQKFKPDRFNDLTSEQKNSYFPFGLGRRVCLGESLARQELPAMLAHLLRDFHVSLAGEFPKPYLHFALGPAKPTMMNFDAR